MSPFIIVSVVNSPADHRIYHNGIKQYNIADLLQEEKLNSYAIKSRLLAWVKGA